MLPQKKSEIKNKPWEYHWLIYGQPKIGKSTFVSQFNDPLFIATEDRLGGLSVYKVPSEGAVKTWVEFISICKTIEKSIKENTFKWKTIVIDTVDNLIQMCGDYVCAKNGISHQSDLDHGKGWAFVTNEFFRIINPLSSLGKSLIFISHSEEKNVKTRISEITKIVPTIGSGKLAKKLLEMTDIIAYIGFDKDNPEKRMIYLRGNECLEAGDTTGSLDPIMPFDYAEIDKKFSETKKIKSSKTNTEIEKNNAEDINKKNNSLEKMETENTDFDFNEEIKSNKDIHLDAINICKNLDDLKSIWNAIRQNKLDLEKKGEYLDLMLAKDNKKRELTKNQ